ncbi:ubiquitin family protein [Pseudothermotoga sp.]|uniref:hypothetical protein n=1 Tax=Pseudothermotoga sp. TaxID=2033661 RepID=UPI00299892E5|nr:hypothetical protein [Pseudothermotoga sp.]MCX7812573.1 hypothetical protein [Pseudothermotoga sp.]MDW8138852.1 hypothetical protein [Pseudothermotoga sp.]
MKVKFSNIADTMVGIKEIEVNPGKIEEVFEQVSKVLGKKVRLDLYDDSAYLIVEENGTVRKSWVIALLNGINVVDLSPSKIWDGELVIFVPVSGG